MRNFLKSWIIIATMYIPGSASASVIYDFSYEAGRFSGSFTYQSSDYVSSLTFLNSANLQSCNAIFSGGNVACSFSYIDPNFSNILFGANYPILVNVSPIFTNVNFAQDGLFFAPVSVRTTDVGIARLRISSSAVPEPSAWALMVAGFGVVGIALRRRASVEGSLGAS